VLIKEVALSNHVVLQIANITPSTNNKSKSVVLELSDGAYSLPAYVKGDKETNGADERYDCDKLLLEMLKAGRIKCGDKFHFFGLFIISKGLPAHDAWPP